MTKFSVDESDSDAYSTDDDTAVEKSTEQNENIPQFKTTKKYGKMTVCQQSLVQTNPNQ